VKRRGTDRLSDFRTQSIDTIGFATQTMIAFDGYCPAFALCFSRQSIVVDDIGRMLMPDQRPYLKVMTLGRRLGFFHLQRPGTVEWASALFEK
jgi:hypothetical protein